MTMIFMTSQVEIRKYYSIAGKEVHGKIVSLDNLVPLQCHHGKVAGSRNDFGPDGSSRGESPGEITEGNHGLGKSRHWLCGRGWKRGGRLGDSRRRSRRSQYSRCRYPHSSSRRGRGDGSFESSRV